jgi:hypothetical protein
MFDWFKKQELKSPSVNIEPGEPVPTVWTLAGNIEFQDDEDPNWKDGELDTLEGLRTLLARTIEINNSRLANYIRTIYGMEDYQDFLYEAGLLLAKQ